MIMRYDCPLCHHERSRLYSDAHKLRTGKKRDIYKCDECGLLYPRPRMGGQETEVYIDSLYDDRPFGQFADPLKVMKGYRVRRWLQPRGSFLNMGLFAGRSGVSKEKALDVGASIGYFCSVLRSLGFDAYGLEPSRSSARFARSKGLNVLEGSFPDKIPDELSAERFAMISMLESVYYMNDFEAALNKVRHLLKSGGFFLMKCHHADSSYYKDGAESFFKRYGDHVQFMPTLDSLRHALEKTGFEIVRVTGSLTPPTSPVSLRGGLKMTVLRKAAVFTEAALNKIYEFTMLKTENADQLIVLARKRGI